MSADGSKVLFTSLGRNLVPGQVNPPLPTYTSQAFWYDRSSGQVLMASHSPSSTVTAANNSVLGLALSGDGSTVIFLSRATDLAPQDFNGLPDVFAWDTSTAAVSLISLGDQDNPMRSASGFLPNHSLSVLGSQSPDGPFISADGRFLVVGSGARNLEPSYTVGTNNLFLFDRFRAEFRLITHAVGDPLLGSNADPEAASISADGRYVVYMSSAALAPNASYGTNCYTWDRLTGLNTSLSGACADVIMNADGRYVVYASGPSIRLFDRLTGVSATRESTVGHRGHLGQRPL